MNDDKPIDCSGFNFHCPENRSYVIFDPQSQEENDRLDSLLGATPLWEKTIAQKRKEISTTETAMISPFTEYHPVGWTETGEGVLVVLAGAIAKHGNQILHKGQWFAVRCRPENAAELQQDLMEELEKRKLLVQQGLGNALKP
jgi:hypothetical protein